MCVVRRWPYRRKRCVVSPICRRRTTPSLTPRGKRPRNRSTTSAWSIVWRWATRSPNSARTTIPTPICTCTGLVSVLPLPSCFRSISACRRDCSTHSLWGTTTSIGARRLLPRCKRSISTTACCSITSPSPCGVSIPSRFGRN